MRVQFLLAVVRIVQEVLDTRSVNLDGGGNFVDETRRRCIEVNAEHSHRKLAVRLSVLDDGLRDDPNVVLAGDVQLIGS